MECSLCQCLLEKGVTGGVCSTCISRNVLNAKHPFALLSQQQSEAAAATLPSADPLADYGTPGDIISTDELVRYTLTREYLALGFAPSPHQQRPGRQTARSVSSPTYSLASGTDSGTEGGGTPTSNWRQSIKVTSALSERKKAALEKKYGVAWGDYPECGVCLKILKRKHHCRNCGLTVCDKCSDWMKLDERKERVCAFCKFPRFFGFAKGLTAFASPFERMHGAMRRRNPAVAQHIRNMTVGARHRRRTATVTRRASMASIKPASAGRNLSRSATAPSGHDDSEPPKPMIRARSNSSASRVAARVQKRLALRRRQSQRHSAEDITQLPPSAAAAMVALASSSRPNDTDNAESRNVVADSAPDTNTNTTNQQGANSGFIEPPELLDLGGSGKALMSAPITQELSTGTPTAARTTGTAQRCTAADTPSSAALDELLVADDVVAVVPKHRRSHSRQGKQNHSHTKSGAGHRSEAALTKERQPAYDGQTDAAEQTEENRVQDDDTNASSQGKDEVRPELQVDLFNLFPD